MANRLTNLNVEFVSLVDRAAVRDPQNPTQPQRFLVWKSESAGGDTPPPPSSKGDQMTPEEMAAAVAKAEQERDDALEATKKAETDRDTAIAKADEFEKAAKSTEPAEPAVDDLAKADPAIRARLEKAEADAVAANERLEKAEKIAKEEREIRITGEFIKKAETFDALPVDPQTFGPVLKSASEHLSKEEYAELETVLKGADEQISKGQLFKEHGRSGEPTADGPEASLEKAATDLRKADSSLSSFQAMQQAMRENPELAARQLENAR